ncbi:hypothetical protein BAE44_0016277 [Dichanthelium oligosanthes]|uniref:Uncharacterized protein n=1 Tax=Dichanthelium oligosanthes TaxID=888268 RepID=A0A1E5VCF7_9POAL|nr:hypothetical protein BAE44_0016277 [Dichanthelium oligosanthes]
MAMAMPLRPFHLAAISLAFLGLHLPHTTTAAETSTSITLPSRASALPMNAPSPATGRLDASPPVSRRHEDQDATAPLPQDAPTTTPPTHRARAAAHARYTHYGVSLADLRSVCQPPICSADPDHRLLSVLYGPHIGGSRLGNDVYCVVRTIEGTWPILPITAWTAFIYSGGDACHAELGYMNYGSFFAIACPAWTCERHITESPEEALAWAISAIATPCGARGVTTSSAATPSPPNATALLPLLAVAFLPPPLAAAVVLSSLASLALAADLFYEEFTELNHATCAVFTYDNATGTVDRARPVPGLRVVVCQRPLCIDADLNERTLSVAHAERHGRRHDPLRVYCAVHSIDDAASPSILFPWRNTWRAHLPVADPGAAAASGDHLCYVELAHMDYREGYYIRCPADAGHARVSCTEFPDEAVAAAVWEHRSLTYCDTVGPKCDRYKYGTTAQLWVYDDDAEL